MKKTLLLLLCLFWVACSSEDKVYLKSEVYQMAVAEDPKAELIIPEDITKGIKCYNYGPGCMGGVTAKILGLKMIAVEYNSKKSARSYALKIDQYYARNWVFDDVKGEPPLERFVKKVYGAKLATKEYNEKNQKK